MLKTFVALVIPFVMLAIAGCGGGASDLSGTLSLSVSAPADSTQPGTATATYTPVGGKNPLGMDIAFSTDHPELVALETGSRKVGSDGTAKVTFMTTTPLQTTTVRINASTGGLSTFQIFTITGNSSAPPPVTPGLVTPTQIQVQPTTPLDGKLALKGTGTSVRPENGFITFKVLDASNSPVAGQVVNFTVIPALNNGGVTLTTASLTTLTDGSVTVGISAGSTQVTAQVVATLASFPTLTASAQFSVTSGPPDDDSFSISAVTLNSETFNHDGVKIPITVRLADHFNNPPPAGTVVLFTTNGGKIDGSGLTDASGNVTVNWESQAPRLSSGRFVIMARCAGEESFTDANGNGLADSGEFTDTGDAYLDANNNGFYDFGEFYIPSVNGASYSGGDNKYNGMYQGALYTSAPKTKNIFKNMELVMSTDAADITVLSQNPITGPGLISFTVTDTNGNTMAAGTTITVTADNGKLGAVTSFIVPQNTGIGQTYSVPISSDGTASTGSVTISVKSPGGLETVGFILTSGI